MTLQVKKKIVPVLMAGMLAGCVGSTTKPATDASSTSTPDSIALQVMKAYGRSKGLRDLEVGETVDLSRSGIITAADATLAYRFANNLEAPPAGISNNAMSAFFVLSLLNDETLFTRKAAWLQTWMPETLAPNPLAAQLQWSELLENASIQALPDGYEARSFEWRDKAVLGAESTYRVLRVNGPLCGEWSCILTGGFSNREEPEKDMTGRMQLVKTPDFTKHNTSESYALTGYDGVLLKKIVREYDEEGAINGHWHRIETDVVKGFDHTAFLKQLSASLPDWVYYYVGPENEQYQTPLPVVLNRGEELFFVKKQEVLANNSLE